MGCAPAISSAAPNPRDFGLSGVEFAGTADDQTRFATPRAAQLGQAIAYPWNVANPFNPLQCAQVRRLAQAASLPWAPHSEPAVQHVSAHTTTAPPPPCHRAWRKVLTYGVALAGVRAGRGDPGPMPAGNASSAMAAIPFCLDTFNFDTLDDVSHMAGLQGGSGPADRSYAAAGCSAMGSQQQQLSFCMCCWPGPHKHASQALPHPHRHSMPDCLATARARTAAQARHCARAAMGWGTAASWAAGRQSTVAPRPSASRLVARHPAAWLRSGTPTAVGRAAVGRAARQPGCRRAC